ncbi:hypothetical protein [Thermodesulforhabdus norvegica]|uniref:Uncharacterized protein n=1 Tax=Thermodesulforhabdus norvegica TaxID=39841 RepID=A0A1I4UHQ5_9BACT|nr:hypothetical protein [Thermodesulforhabdus norvegica]SFM88445.1 hypothetical protein SAMN05660836_01802 [Thermodesulforhabdus norvegica]
MWRDRYKNFQAICLQHKEDILNAAIHSWTGIDLSKEEQEIIRQYLLQRNVGIDFLNQKLAPILSKNGFIVKFASIYVHQKPQVTRLSNVRFNKCELGDLLVIFILFDISKKPIINSAFIAQAKKHFKIDNLCQKE